MKQLETWKPLLCKDFQLCVDQKTTVWCSKSIHFLYTQVYQAFWSCITIDIRDKIYQGILGVLKFWLIFPTHFSKKGGIYGTFSKIRSQNLDYLRVLRYNFRDSRN